MPIASLLQYAGSVGPHINIIIENDNIIKGTIVPSSIGELEIAQSINLRGSPTTRTQSVSDNSTRIATTEFVKKQTIDNLISYENDRPLSANMGRLLNQRKADTDDVIKLIMDLRGFDVIDTLDSTNTDVALSANMGRHLDLTKAPRIHTSPSGSTFGIATVALFGHARSANSDPLMDGTVFRGTDDGHFARADHRHPSDTTKLDAAALGKMVETYEGKGNDVMSEFIGFTTELNNTPNENGAVTRVLFNVPFKNFKANVPIVSVNGGFKALMGNGTMIVLSNPTQMSKTQSHATIMFTMATPYPSNSPCMLVYTDKNSNIKVEL